MLAVRLSFVGLTVFGGLGPLLYALLWIFLPQETAIPAAEAPGLDSARRRGYRGQDAGRSRREDAGQLLAVAVLGFGVLIALQSIGGISAGIFWPVVLGAVGLAVIWRQADEAQRSRWAQASPGLPVIGPLLGAGAGQALLRSGAGLVLVVIGATLLLAGSGGVSALARGAAAVMVGLAGIALIVGPWIWRLATDLSTERSERIRSQERADMAAHLHDSVLQTLALIQKQAHDSKAVVRLARAQERDLRTWLYDASDDADETLKSALTRAVAEVEDAHGTAVEVVTVGDAPLEPALIAVLRAAREAMVNAAKHANTPGIDVYAEVTPDSVEVFVRDRGQGFDPDTVPVDRLGVRNSIYERMRRHGGTADIRSTPGEGTEVRLVMPRGSA